MSEKRAFWNMVITLGPVVGLLMSIGAAAANEQPLAVSFATFLLYSVGISLFLKAKFSVIRNGQLFSFGPFLMTPLNKTFYKAGYALMGVGTLLAINLIFISH